MQILVIADDEGLLGSLPESHADILISCGDVPDRLILEYAKRSGCKQILAVKGNHDSSADFSPGITDLHLDTIMIGDFKFGGFAGAWRYKPVGNYLFDQKEVNFFVLNFQRQMFLSLTIRPAAFTTERMMSTLASRVLCPTLIVLNQSFSCMGTNT